MNIEFETVFHAPNVEQKIRQLRQEGKWINLIAGPDQLRKGADLKWPHIDDLSWSSTPANLADIVTYVRPNGKTIRIKDRHNNIPQPFSFKRLLYRIFGWLNL
jgi:hypothetical protein